MTSPHSPQSGPYWQPQQARPDDGRGPGRGDGAAHVGTGSAGRRRSLPVIASAVALVVGGGIGLGAAWLVFDGGDTSAAPPPETPTETTTDGVDQGAPVGDQVAGTDGGPGAVEASYACDLAQSFDNPVDLDTFGLDDPPLWHFTAVEQLAVTAGIEDPQYAILQESAQGAQEHFMNFDVDGMNDALDDVRAACDELGLPSGGSTPDDRAQADAALACVLVDAFEEDEQVTTWGGWEDDPHLTRIASMQVLTEAASLADSTYESLADHAEAALFGAHSFDDDGVNSALADVRGECESLGL